MKSGCLWIMGKDTGKVSFPACIDEAEKEPELFCVIYYKSLKQS